LNHSPVQDSSLDILLPADFHPIDAGQDATLSGGRILYDHHCAVASCYDSAHSSVCCSDVMGSLVDVTVR